MIVSWQHTPGTVARSAALEMIASVGKQDSCERNTRGATSGRRQSVVPSYGPPHPAKRLAEMVVHRVIDLVEVRGEIAVRVGIDPAGKNVINAVK